MARGKVGQERDGGGENVGGKLRMKEDNKTGKAV